MVRINLFEVERLADQHLIAEYDEILMLLGYVKKYPEPLGIPENFSLGKGHIKFFKNKILYLKKRHELIKKEMQKRGFKTEKTINLNEFNKELLNDWKPSEEDMEIVKERVVFRLKEKPNYYRYHGEKKDIDFFVNLIEE